MGPLEPVLVGLIVLGCAIFSAWRLMSTRLQLKTLDALSGLAPLLGGRWMAALRRRTLAKLPGGCGACSQAASGLNANGQSLNRKSAAPRR
jgi:hypothetical protein